MYSERIHDAAFPIELDHIANGHLSAAALLDNPIDGDLSRLNDNLRLSSRPDESANLQELVET